MVQILVLLAIIRIINIIMQKVSVAVSVIVSCDTHGTREKRGNKIILPYRKRAILDETLLTKDVTISTQ